MKNTKKRMTALLLALCLVVALIPTSCVYAKDDTEAASYPTLSESLVALYKVVNSGDFVNSLSQVNSYSELEKKTYNTYLNLGDCTSIGLNLGTDSNITGLVWGQADEASWTYQLAEELGIALPSSYTTAEGALYLDMKITPREGNCDVIYMKNNLPLVGAGKGSIVKETSNAYASLSRNGFRTWELNNLLGTDAGTDGYYEAAEASLLESCPLPEVTYPESVDYDVESSYDNLYKTVAWTYGGVAASTLTDVQAFAQQAVKDANLITLSVGLNDLLYFPAYASAYDVTLNWDAVIDGLPASVSQKVKAVRTALEAILSEETEEEAETLVDYILYGYLGAVTQSTQLFNRIHELNPVADLAIIGLDNPYKSVKLVLDEEKNISIDIGSLLSPLVASLNQFYWGYAVRNSDWCCYVNPEETGKVTSQVGSLSIVSDSDHLKLNGFAYTEESHDVITQSVLKALGYVEEPVTTPTDIDEPETPPEKPLTSYQKRIKAVLEAALKVTGTTVTKLSEENAAEAVETAKSSTETAKNAISVFYSTPTDVTAIDASKALYTAVKDNLKATSVILSKAITKAASDYAYEKEVEAKTIRAYSDWNNRFLESFKAKFSQMLQ